MSDTCRALGLPEPPPCTPGPKFIDPTLRRKLCLWRTWSRQRDCSVTRCGCCDGTGVNPSSWWATNFCDLINLEMRLAIPSYDDIVKRMRERSYVLFRGTFRQKLGYLITHDWRVRECKKAADLLCNVCLGLEHRRRPPQHRWSSAGRRPCSAVFRWRFQGRTRCQRVLRCSFHLH